MRNARSLYFNLRYNGLLVLIIGGLVQWVVGFGAQEYLRWLGWVGAILWGGSVTLTIVAVVILYQISLGLIKRIWSLPVNTQTPSPSPRRGMIMLLGRTEYALAALQPHPRLEHLWLVVTDVTNPRVVELGIKLSGRIVTLREWVNDVYRPSDCADAVQKAVSEAKAMGFPIEELICDVTGGTTVMTVGAFQRCIELGVDIQMVTARYTKEGDSPVPDKVISVYSHQKAQNLVESVPSNTGEPNK